MRITRHRHEEHQEELDRAPTVFRPSTQRVLVQIFDGGAMPTSTPGYFVGHPVAVRGDECDGCEATYLVDSDTTVPVYVIGSRNPVVGDKLIAVSAGGRWVAESGATSSSGGGISCLTCTEVPETLTLTIVSHGTNWFLGGNEGEYSLVYTSPAPSWFTTLYPFAVASPIYLGPCIENAAHTFRAVLVAMCYNGGFGFTQIGCGPPTMYNCPEQCATSGPWICINDGFPHTLITGNLTCVGYCTTSYSCDPFHVSVSGTDGTQFHIDE